jgi:serine/threonine protein kinase
MSTKQKVVGEGTFGCVISPSLECADQDTDYTNKVSKVMYKNDADNESREYATVDKADPQMKYHIGKPVQCIPTYRQKDVINNCEKFKADEFNEYDILVMEDGGDNLDTFVRKKGHTPQSVANFWREARNILEGLIMLKQHHLTHHDLKPQNIVYKTRMKLIDFGKLVDQTNVKRESISSVYKRSKLHFNYPPELYYINRNKYMELAGLSDEDKETYIDEYCQEIKDKCPYLFQLIKPVKREWFFLQIQFMIMKDLKSTNYNDFLKKTIDTIDVYGVGLSFLYVLQYFAKYMPEDIATRMQWLFRSAIHPDVFQRATPETLLSAYDEIMNKWPVEKSASLSSNALSAVAEIELDLPAPAKSVCPPNKEWNPKTRRCNKKCGKHSHRNENFKCVRNTKRKK